MKLKGDEDEVLTSRQVSVMLKVHIYTVNDLCRTGRLKAFKIKRRWRIKKQSVIKFMAQEI